MAPPRRLYGKQPPTSGSSADRMLGTGAKARKERTQKRSKLAKATQSGLVPRAQRPFAIYCKMTRQRVQEASQVWKRLSAKGRQPYIEASQRTFKDQQKKSKEVGLRYKSAMAVELDAKDQAASRPTTPFGLFCKETKQNCAQASKAWKALGEEERQKYVQQNQNAREGPDVPAGKPQSELVMPLTKNLTYLGKHFEMLSSQKQQQILGHGTYGTVYVVQHVQRRGNIFAAKIETMTRSLHKEVEILRLFDHPSVLPIVDSSVLVGGLSWMVVPLMPGNLHCYLRNSNKFDDDGKIALFHQLVSGIGHVHSHYVVHCDIKPGNILVDPFRQSFRLCDFGLALKVPVAQEERRNPVYSLPYRPPELCSAECDLCIHLNVRCDSWAAGLTMAEAGCGKRFFSADCRADVMVQIQDFCQEASTGLGGPVSRRLKEAMGQVPASIRKSVSSMLRLNNQLRATCQMLTE